VLEELGARVHLAHALGNNWGNRRVKNGERDAKDLAAMLRLGSLLVAALLVWNVYFLAALLYRLTVENRSKGLVTRIVATVWVWGDVLMVLASIAVWAVRRSRRNAA